MTLIPFFPTYFSTSFSTGQYKELTTAPPSSWGYTGEAILLLSVAWETVLMHAFFPNNDWFICAGNLEQSLGTRNWNRHRVVAPT
jgi:hypothetical protein